MHNGKNKCNKLKEIRKVIADANDIYYNPTPCSSEGDCKGTCPKCESEMRYIENQLYLRQQTGRAIKILGLATSILSLPACENQQTAPPVTADEDTTVISFMNETIYQDGEIRLPDCFADGWDSLTDMVPPPEEYELEHVSKDSLEQLVKDTSIFINVDNTACYVNGGMEFYNVVLTYIYRSEEYKNLTEEEKTNLWFGVQFVVERDGSITNLKVVKSTNAKLDNVVCRAVERTSGKWLAATRYDRKVRSRMGMIIVVDNLNEPAECRLGGSVRSLFIFKNNLDNPTE